MDVELTVLISSPTSPLPSSSTSPENRLLFRLAQYYYYCLSLFSNNVFSAFDSVFDCCWWIVRYSLRWYFSVYMVAVLVSVCSFQLDNSYDNCYYSGWLDKNWRNNIFINSHILHIAYTIKFYIYPPICIEKWSPVRVHADIIDERIQIFQTLQTCGGLIVIIRILYHLHRISVDVRFLFSE